jgi:hypothetical protein
MYKLTLMHLNEDQLNIALDSIMEFLKSDDTPILIERDN